MKQFLSYMKNLRDRWSNGSELRTANQSMCMLRYFEVPDDEIEIPRILEDLANLFAECRNLCSSDSIDWLHETMRVGIARIDYALIEKGRDFGALICELHNPYYDRQKHLSCSGHSEALIKYYLEKYAIVIKSTTQYLSKEGSGQHPADQHLHFELRSHPENASGLTGKMDPNEIVDTKFESQNPHVNPQANIGIIKIHKDGTKEYLEIIR